MKEPSIEEQIDTALHVDWAFKDVHGKPDKIIVSGYPKGAYHTGYEQFRSNMVALIQSERRKAALECLKARIEGFDIAYDCYDYKRLNKLKTSWNEELASLESNTEKEK